MYNIYEDSQDNHYIISDYPLYTVYKKQVNKNTWEVFDSTSTFFTLSPDGSMYKMIDSTTFRSDDSGITWNQLPQQIDIKPFKNRTVFSKMGTILVLDYDKLYRSSDKGVTYINVTPQFFDAGESLLSIQGGGLFVFGTKTIGGFNHACYYSADDGLTWIAKSNVNSKTVSRAFETKTGRVFFYGYEAGIGKFSYTDNKGIQINYSSLNNSYYYISSIIQLKGGTLLLCTDEGDMYYSNDDGTNWIDLPKVSPNLTDIYLQSNGTFYAQYENCNDLYISADSTFQNLSFYGKGMKNPVILDLLAVTDDTLYSMTSAGIFKSMNGGDNWIHIIEKPIVRKFSYAPAHYFGIDKVTNQIVLASLNDLNKFDQTTSVLQEITPMFLKDSSESIVSFNILKNNDYCISTGKAIYISKNHGVNWTRIPLMILPSPGFNQALLIDEQTYIIGNDYYVYKFTINDTSISDMNLIYKGSFNSIDINNNGIILLGKSGAENLCGSVDGGENWICHSDPNYKYPIEELLISDDGTMIMTPYIQNKMYFSVDNGITWNIVAESSLYNIQFSKNQNLWGLSTKGIYFTTSFPFHPSRIKGLIYDDSEISNCIKENDEPSKYSIISKIVGNGNTLYGASDKTGKYILPADQGNYLVSTIPPSDYWIPCIKNVTIPFLGNEIQGVDLGIKPSVLCPKLNVTMSTFGLRRCFDSNIFVSYCNNGTTLAKDVSIEVTLDSMLTFISSNASIVLNNQQKIILGIGDVDVLECGKAIIKVNVSCNSQLGQVHCIQAHIYPDSNCVENWDGPVIETDAICSNGNIIVKAKNIGEPMNSPVEYFVYQDNSMNSTGLILVNNDQIQLNKNQTVDINITDTGEPIYFRISPPNGYPFGITGAWLDINSCINSSKPFSVFKYNDENLVDYNLCLKNVGSYDPNEKHSSPQGISTHNYIDTSTSIEYEIQFQNTGTDTAFLVVIRDELSPLLDISTLQITGASHNYSIHFKDRTLVATFNNIMLPDSSTNKIASEGFIKFSIRLISQPPIGAQLLNKAAIYFDLNDPIITNETHYTIGVPDLTLTYNIDEKTINVFPNPSNGEINFMIPENLKGSVLNLIVRDMLGISKYQQELSDKSEHHYNFNDLSSGMYCIEIRDKQFKLILIEKWLKL